MTPEHLGDLIALGREVKWALAGSEHARLPAGSVLRHDSIVGSTFTGTVLGSVYAGGHRALLPQVTGMTYRTGEHRFVVDPHDPLVPWFVLR